MIIIIIIIRESKVMHDLYVISMDIQLISEDDKRKKLIIIIIIIRTQQIFVPIISVKYINKQDSLSLECGHISKRWINHGCASSRKNSIHVMAITTTVEWLSNNTNFPPAAKVVGFLLNTKTSRFLVASLCW